MWLDRLAVVPPDPEQTFLALSGGNQQRVILAKWLRRNSRVLLLDEPTLGVDAGAKRKVYEELRLAASGGAAVLVASSDTEELVEVCDRLLIMANGTVRAHMDGPVTEAEIFAAMAGAT